MSFTHKPVLLQEAIEFLSVREGQKYIDATAGGGGYTEAMLHRGGTVLSVDTDPDAISHLRNKFDNDKNLTLVNDNYSNIDSIAEENHFDRVAGIVFDLGLSSHQIEESGRGFSFRRDEVLDMRMGSKQNLTAADIVNKWSKEELYELFSKMGEERFALTIANNIVRSRGIKRIESSLELAGIIEDSVPGRGKIHPATRVFQALRIAVNNEIINLKTAIDKGFELLEMNGRMVIVSFHSLEDRIVKNKFRELEDNGKAKILVKKPVLASESETLENKRSRSAKLRVIERIL